MKRWQRLGEVQDSDEEDFDGDTEPSSPERPTKRAKQSQSLKPEEKALSAGALARFNGEDVEDTDAWVQPKVVARTYGKNSRLAAPAPPRPRDEPPNALELTVNPDGANERSGERAPLRAASSTCHNKDLGDSVPLPQPEMAATSGSDAKSTAAAPPSSPPLGLPSALDIFDIPNDEPLQEPSVDPVDARSRRSSSPLSDLDSLPDVPSLLQGTAKLNLETLRAQSASDPVFPNSRRGSTPLSDLDSLPDVHSLLGNNGRPDVEATHPRTNSSFGRESGAQQGSDRNQASLSKGASEQFAIEIDAVPQPVVLIDTQIDGPGGRSLRARKEKQLHPYMYEKALYQKQCKQGGVRPVRLLDEERQERETQQDTQDETLSGSSQLQRSNTVSPGLAVADTSLGPVRRAEPSRIHFNLLDRSSESELDFPQPIAKRRKLGPLPREREEHAEDSQDLSVRTGLNPGPPSPPQTCSNASTPLVSQPRHSVFRMPPGFAPVPLPTPQISSSHRRPDDESPTADVSPRKSRPSTTSKLRGRPAVIEISSSSSSDAESDHEVSQLQGRLQRDRKRLKGVLPASWLKIDFRAQRARVSPSADRLRDGSVSPPRSEPLKGVARKVMGTRPPNQAEERFTMLPGSETEAETVGISHLATHPFGGMRATLLGRRPAAPTESLLGEAMENNWVDPMLAGSSRQAAVKKKRRPKQPRINDAFRSASQQNTRPSEVKLASRAGQRRRAPGNTKGTRTTRKRQPPHLSPVRLSIVDAPRSPTPGSMPQFVRLALRRARAQPDRGRQSPSNKFLRLATMRETEEASSVLRAWEAGSILPKPVDNGRGPHLRTQPSLPQEPASRTRLPLSDIPINRLPAFPRNDAKENGQSATGDWASRTPRFRQVQLQATVLNEQDSTSSPTQSNHRTINAPLRQIARPRPRHQPPAIRNAQLESLENDFEQEYRATAFERRIRCLTEFIARPGRTNQVDAPRLASFLQHRDASEALLPVAAGTLTTRGDEPTSTAPIDGLPPIPYRPRKRHPRRLDVDTREYRQPSEPLPSSVPDLTVPETVQSEAYTESGPVLQGLSRFGARYAVDFDVRPLDVGTFMRASTFIGSGEFKDALALAARDFGQESGHVRVHMDGQVFEWGVWNEDADAHFARIPTIISAAIESLEVVADYTAKSHLFNALDRNVDHLLRSVVRYCSKCLRFADPVDRASCVASLIRLVVDLADAIAGLSRGDDRARKTAARIAQYRLVISKVASQLCQSPIVSTEARKRTDELLTDTSRTLASQIVTDGTKDLRVIYEDTRRTLRREAGISDDAWPLINVILLNSIPAIVSQATTLCSQTICDVLCPGVTKLFGVNDLDRIWFDAFTILPALEMDSSGVVTIGSRLLQSSEDWRLVRGLVSRNLELYDASSHVRGSTLNDYIRAVLKRCHRLVNQWGWRRCEPLLGVVYDFFARRGLALLRHEESRGSPKFLEELQASPCFEVQEDDCSFHVFLKLVASGIRGMAQHHVYEDRKISGIVWRFIPSHDRTYKKDTDVQRSDLEALRNHFDLLATLYYALPAGYRLRVDLFRRLVDHSTSHREACRLSIRAWSNITSFQASTREPAAALDPLAEWYVEMMKTTLGQYRLARLEVEQGVKDAQQNGISEIRPDLVENTITQNQRQIAATMVDALAGLKRALSSSSSLDVARRLVEGTSFWTFLEIFDPSQRRLVSVMLEALYVIETVFDLEDTCGSSQESQQLSEDSQEFGDSSALQELVASEGGPATPATVHELLLDPIGHFVSNVIGADTGVDDSLAQKVVDVWVRLVQVTVQQSSKTWLSYVGEYGKHSWFQLRDTKQKRTFTPYFIARVAACNDVDSEMHQRIITAWIVSLAERESLLKFQHELTTTLLNTRGTERLLENPPFSKDDMSERYQVSPRDLQRKRLALISSVLNNMRDHFDELFCEQSDALPEVQNVYAGMLRQLMQAMKSNYQELQASSSSEIANSEAQGAYVAFVQQVVSSLQQHTAGICQVDRFFTDSSAFPLPAGDPTYVVGRLRSYVPKLAGDGTRKRLAVFIHTVSERAAVDGQQQYLVKQLYLAMKGVREKGNRKTPTLRHVLLTSIIPAYIEKSLQTSSSWIMVLPLLQTCEQVVGDMLYAVEFEDENSLSSAVEIMSSLLHYLEQPCHQALHRPDLLGTPNAMRLLKATFEIARSCLTFGSYVQRLKFCGSDIVQRLDSLRTLGSAIEARLNDPDNETSLDFPVPAQLPACPWPDTREYVQKQVQDSLSDWSLYDGRYFKRGGNTFKELPVQLSDAEEEREGLLRGIASFCRAYEATFERRGGRSRRRDEYAGGGCDLDYGII